MVLSPADIRNAHAAFGAPETIVDRRRALYAAVVELASNGAATADADDVLDNPAVRAHLATVINGGPYRPDAMTPLSRLVTRPSTTTAGSPAYLVAEPAARTALEGAIAHLAASLGVPPGRDDGIRLLVRPEPGFAEASELVGQGVDLAYAVCPELAGDLLSHVAGFALVTGAEQARLGSASLREYPGLIVLPQPSSALEVAEALVHEGAHQLFFDLCVTCTILVHPGPAAPRFRASWSPASRPSWPLEQCLAAFHAYTCLATFHERVLRNSARLELHDSSLLDVAANRAVEIGRWLARHNEFIGPDGRRFVSLLSGASVASHKIEYDTGALAQFVLNTSCPTTMRHCGGWTVVARQSDNIELFWMRSAGTEPSRLGSPAAERTPTG